MDLGLLLYPILEGLDRSFYGFRNTLGGGLQCSLPSFLTTGTVTLGDTSSFAFSGRWSGSFSFMALVYTLFTCQALDLNPESLNPLG